MWRLYIYTVNIKECEKWLLTDKSELTEPYKMKLSKPFKNVITFGPGRSCKPFKLWLLNYQQPKLDSYFIILNKKPDISIFTSGVFDHDSEGSKIYKDMIITDANEYLNELFNKYLI